MGRSILAAAHVLAGAAWLGAMFYSLVVLHPRARRFFESPRRFEDFITYLAAGARWKVLGGAIFIALTGAGLLLGRTTELTHLKWICLVAKIILFTVAVSVFCFTSWVLWPARSLASTEEIPKFQRKFKIVAVTLIGLVAASMVLGVISAHL